MQSKLLSCIVFLYKVVQKIGCFSNCIFCSFLRSDLKNGQLESSKLGTIVHEHLVSKNGARDVEIRHPSHFLLSFLKKKK